MIFLDSGNQWIPNVSGNSIQDTFCGADAAQCRTVCHVDMLLLFLNISRISTILVSQYLLHVMVEENTGESSARVSC